MSRFIVVVLLFASALLARAENTPYRINPGDILIVYGCNEKDLPQEMSVYLDDKISDPLERKSR